VIIFEREFEDDGIIFDVLSKKRIIETKYIFNVLLFWKGKVYCHE
jgi:hypothetical protein